MDNGANKYDTLKQLNSVKQTLMKRKRKTLFTNNFCNEVQQNTRKSLVDEKIALSKKKLDLRHGALPISPISSDVEKTSTGPRKMVKYDDFFRSPPEINKENANKPIKPFNRLTVSDNLLLGRKRNKDDFNSDTIFSSQTNLFSTPVRKIRKVPKKIIQSSTKNGAKLNTSSKQLLSRPLISIPTLATIGSVEYNEFSLSRDYRALKLEMQRESAVQSQIDTQRLQHGSSEICSQLDATDDEERFPDSPSLLSSKRKPRKINFQVKSDKRREKLFETSQSIMSNEKKEENKRCKIGDVGLLNTKPASDNASALLLKINRTSDDKALTGELSISQKILSHVSPQICSTSNKHDNEYLSTSNKLVHECNTVFSDSLFFETENIGENTDKLHISPFKQEIDHKCKSEEAYGNNNQALPQSHSPKTFEPSSQKLSIPKMPYSEKLLSPSSKDIFDIDEKESETGSDKNSSTVQELLTAWSDNDVCVKALDEVCQNRTTVSQEPTLLVSEPNDVGVKNGQNRLDTYSKKEIKSISSTPNTKSTTQITNDSNLSQSYCKIEKWFSINDQVKSAKRILYTLLNCDKCVVCVIFSDAAHFYIQDGTNWKLITKLKRFRADIDNSNTLNSLTLLSYCSDASDCHLCLKSFTVSQEGTMKFIKDYSYYCFFNLESCGDVDFSSSEDEIYGDR